MSHDKIRAAARKRMAETGEPYAAARRAVISEHQAAGDHDPAPGRGLRAPDVRRDPRLAGRPSRDSDPPTAARVRRALAALMKEGAGLGDPLVASTAESWPWALAEALDRSYQREPGPAAGPALGRGRRRGPVQGHPGSDRGTGVRAGGIWTMMHRRALDAGRPQEAARAASRSGRGPAAGGRGATAAAGSDRTPAHRLAEQSQRFQARAEAFRVQKEVLKASFIAAESSLRVHQAIAASGLPGDDSGRQQDGGGEIHAAEARLADLTVQMEREAGQQPWPAGPMALRPGALDRDDICILFAVELPGAGAVIAVLEGLDAVAEGVRAVGPGRRGRATGRAGRPGARGGSVHLRQHGVVSAEFAPGAAG